MKNIDTLSKIRRVMENQHSNTMNLANSLSISRSATASMLQKPILQVQRLVELCEVLQYNFFTEIAAELPYAEPDYIKLRERSGNPVPLEDINSPQLLELQNRLKMLEMEVSILRQTLKDVVAR
jgi:hypothetical protein